jgi:UDP-perosamine 4-acetyltransferase
MKEVLIVGAGGHSRVILSILAEQAVQSVIGVIDINLPQLSGGISNELIMDCPVLSLETLNSFAQPESVDIFLAIGDVELRHLWWKKLREAGFSMPNLLSSHAIIDPSVKIGDSNVVCAKVFIGPEACLGNNNLINTGVILEHESSVGNNCHIAPGSIIAGRSHVMDNCFVGAGSVIIDGINLAQSTTLGAGSVLINNVNDSHGVYVGIPARRISEGAK